MTSAVGFKTHIIFRGFIAFALLWQALLPATQAAAREAGFDVRTYMCSPSSAPTSEAARQLAYVLRLAGKLDDDGPSPDLNPDHCSNCVMTPVAILTDICCAMDTSDLSNNLLKTHALNITAWGVRGPPLGSRAPPNSV